MTADPDPHVWAVVPVKPFDRAKHRLAGVLQPWERRTLARLMLHDTLEALARVPGLAGRLVVTADGQAAAAARQLGAEVLHEAAADGLNPAVERAAQAVCARGGRAMLVVPADVPGLQAHGLRALIEAHPQPPDRPALTLVPAHDGRGTNGWLLTPPAALPPSFGADSFVRHQRLAREAGVALRCAAVAGLALDLDQAADLERFAADRAHAGTRTAQFLRTRLPLAATRTAAPRPSCGLPAA